MAELPTIPQRLVMTEAPKSAVTAEDIAKPSKWLGDALERIGNTVEDIGVVSAQQAGEKAVTLGPDGMPQVQTMPILSGKIGHAYNKAALSAYETQLDPKIRDQITTKTAEFDGQPDKFATWFQDYQATLLSTQPDAVRTSVAKRLSQWGDEAQRHLIVQRHTRDVQADVVATNTELKNVADDMEIIARNGGANTEGFNARLQRMDELLAKQVSNPSIAFPKEKAEEMRNAAITRAIGGSVMDGVERVYNEQGYEAARGHLRDAVADVRGQGIAGDNPEATGKYGLKMRDLDKIERQGREWLRTEDSGMRGARDAVTKDWQAMKPQLSTLPTETLIEKEMQAEAVGAVRVAADIRAARISLDLARSLRSVPTEQRAGILSSGSAPADLVNRIISVESGGNPNAQASTSSALGLGQFTKGTWLDTVQKHRPDLLQGKTPDQVLELRRDPQLSREMLGHLATDNADALKAAGVAPSAGNLYLAHFLGAGDAIKVLKADPNVPVAGFVNPQSVSANGSIFAQNSTAGALAAWADRKMGQVDLTQSREGLQAMRILKSEMGRDLTKRIDDLNSADKKLALPSVVEIAQLGAMAHAVGTPEQQKRVEELMLQARAGQNFSKMTAPQRAEALGAINAELKAGGERYSRELRDKLTEADNHISEAYKKDAYGAYYRYAEGAQALPALDITQPDAGDLVKAKETQRAQIMAQEGIPSFSVLRPAEAKAFKGLLFSNDPNQVAQAASFAANMLNRDPGAFAGVDGKEQIEKDAVTFQHYVEDLGMSSAQAAGQIVSTRQPEYQAKIKSKMKNEDIDEKIKKEVSPSDLAGAFDRIPWLPFTDPKVAFTTEQKQTMFSGYAELVRDFYLDNGDIGLSKKLAANQMKNTYGVTDISGRGVVMAYPPEKQPQLAGIDNAADLIASQAISSIKAETGTDVKRGDLVILPVPGATSAAFRSGQPAPYQLGWFDGNRVLHWTDPGRAFVVDAKTLRDQQSMERERQFRNRDQAVRDAAEGFFAGVQ